MNIAPTPYPPEMWLTTQDDRKKHVAAGGGSASYWVLEEDGTSKWTLEEGNGFWITEESS